MRNAVTIADAIGMTKADIFDIDGAYDTYLRKKTRDDRQGHFHPSAIGMCGRRNVYEFIRTPALPTIEPEDLEIFDMGHAVHGLVQGRLAEIGRILKPQKIGYEFRAEVRYDPETDVLYKTHEIGGTTDGILEVWADSWRQRGIIEIKSINAANFAKLRGPKKDHVLQAHLYCYRYDCPQMWIWYFNKDTSRRKVYPLVFQQDLLDEAIDRFAEWHQHALSGTLPERTEGYFSCPRCEYREVCKPPSLVKLGVGKVNTAKASLR